MNKADRDEWSEAYLEHWPDAEFSRSEKRVWKKALEHVDLDIAIEALDRQKARYRIPMEVAHFNAMVKDIRTERAMEEAEELVEEEVASDRQVVFDYVADLDVGTRESVLNQIMRRLSPFVQDQLAKLNPVQDFQLASLIYEEMHD